MTALLASTTRRCSELAVWRPIWTNSTARSLARTSSRTNFSTTSTPLSASSQTLQRKSATTASARATFQADQKVYQVQMALQVVTARTVTQATTVSQARTERMDQM